MMHRRFHMRFAAVALAAVAFAASAARHAIAAEFKAGDIAVEAPWSRATPGGAKVGAGYLTIKNGGAAPDRLVSATADIAERTEIHEMSMSDGMMKMRQVSDGVAVPAGGSVALAPNGYHLMFLGLKKPLTEGEHLLRHAHLREGGHRGGDLRGQRDRGGGARRGCRAPSLGAAINHGSS